MTRPLKITPEAAWRLTAPTEPWLSCDDCFDDVDAVVEALLTQGRPMSEPFRVHLGACAVCFEEATSLAALTAGDLGLDPSAAVALLDGVVHG